MRTSERTQWQPGDIELLDVSHLHPDDVLLEISSFLKLEHSIDLETFGNQIMNIAGGLNANVYFEGRPTPKQVRSALKELSRNLTRTQLAFANLDHDSQARISEVAQLDPVNPQTEHVPELFRPNLGVERYGSATRALDKLQRWVTLALESAPEGTPGRKPEEAMHHAVDELRTLFHAYTEKRPTLSVDAKRGTTGALLDFTRAALRPLLDKLSSDGHSDLEYFVSHNLYPRNKRNPAPCES